MMLLFKLELFAFRVKYVVLCLSLSNSIKYIPFYIISNTHNFNIYKNSQMWVLCAMYAICHNLNFIGSFSTEITLHLFPTMFLNS